MNDDIRLIERAPTVAEYQHLRKVVGWGNLSDEATAQGLDNALHSVCLMDGDELIGCGRVVGDGAIYFYIQDIIVLPEYRGRGLSRRIMAEVMKYIETHATTTSFVGLMAASGVAPYYHAYGFKERPPDRPGMFRMWE